MNVKKVQQRLSFYNKIIENSFIITIFVAKYY